MNKIIFHVGPGKTGTSYLQKVLFDNVDYLLSEDVFFPVVVGATEKSNSKYLYNGGLLNVLEDLHNLNVDVIISAEEISLLSNEDLGLLMHLSSNFFEVHVVAFVRSLPKWLFSNYLQAVKTSGFFRDFSTFIKIGFAQKSTPIHFLCELLKLNISGEIHICNYEERENVHELFFDTLNKILQKNIDISFSKEKVNLSLNENQLKLMLLINK